VNTFSVEDRTRMSQPSQDFDSEFERQLPPEIRAELLEETPPRYIGETISPPRPPVVLQTVKPAQSASRRPNAIWWVLGLVLLVGLLPHVISTWRAPSSQPGANTRTDTPPDSRPVEVRRALPVTPVEVRRALPAVLRALPVTGAENPPAVVPYAQERLVTMPDGSIVEARLEGELRNSANLPPRGRFLGETWRTADGTSWVWMTPAGASFPSWVDP
jgi:hypothetical protein